jgi:hypothetical protein
LDDEAGALAIAGGGEAEASIAGGGEKLFGAEDDAEQCLFQLSVGAEDKEGRVWQIETGFNLAQSPGSFAEVGEFAEEFDEIDGAGEGFAWAAEGDEAIEGLVSGSGPILERAKGLLRGIGVVEAGGDPENLRDRVLQFRGSAGEQLADRAEAFAAQDLLPKQALVEQAEGDSGLIGEVGQGGLFVEEDAPASGPMKFQNTRD